jgi:hypothetical protein
MKKTLINPRLRAWTTLRGTPGLINGTMDILFMTHPDNPNVGNQRPHYIRGTIEKITWSRSKALLGRVRTVTLCDLVSFNEKTRGWTTSPSFEKMSVTFRSLGGAPVKKDGAFEFSMGPTCPVKVFPLSATVPRNHSLYLSLAEQKRRDEVWNRFLERFMHKF